MSLSLELLIGSITGFWIWKLFEIFRQDDQTRWLNDVNFLGFNNWPMISIVVAARNEALGVRQAAMSLLELDYPNLELIIVNDRSTDDTPNILSELKQAHPNGSQLSILSVESLPEGWLGKNHALSVGAQAAQGEWLLFTDADIIFEKQTLKKTIAANHRFKADHVTVFPEVLNESFWQKIFLGFFQIAFSVRYGRKQVEDPKSKAYCGIGAFNFVRRSTYQTCGGHNPIKLSVDDDVQLGRLFKMYKFKTKVLFGTHEVKVKWQSDLKGLIRGLEKNFYGALDYNLFLAGLSLLAFNLCVLPVTILWLSLFFSFSNWSLILSFVALICYFLIFLSGYRQNKIPPWMVIFLPIGAIFLTVSGIRSIYLAHKNNGISWRESFYPLKFLRSHCKERNLEFNQIWASAN